MSVRDDLFPSIRHPNFVQTEWSGGWQSAASGFGRAADQLTEQSGSFGAAIDHVGLAIFYLQRHRVELILKGLLHALDQPTTGHKFSSLWHRCRDEVARRDPAAWASIDADHGEFVRALADVDDSSMVFRYPLTLEGKKFDRPAFLDLGVLSRHAEDLFYAFGGLEGYLLAG
jgi:hypothetical protein